MRILERGCGELGEWLRRESIVSCSQGAASLHDHKDGERRITRTEDSI